MRPLFFVPGAGRRSEQASSFKGNEETLIAAMYKDIPAELLAVIEPIVLDHGLEVVDAGVFPGRGDARVRVVVDTPAGDGRVTIDECAAVSREIGHGLDATGVVPGAYALEVSSPGVDRVLGREKDFQLVVGRKVAVETREPIDGRRSFKGELLSFEHGVAIVDTEAGPMHVPFAHVAKAQAFYPFPSKQKRKR